MQVIRLLLRVAFICNICFLFSSLILWLPNPPQGVPISLMIVAGTVVALPVNFIVSGWMAILLGSGKFRASGIPVWLPAANFIFFVIELFTLILNKK
jgi:hypothetical protein